MSNHIKYSVLLLMAGLVAVASCDKAPTPDPEPEAILFADPANSFIVSEPGLYTFKTFKGKTTEPVGSIASVEVLWESFGTSEEPSKGNIVSQAYYKDGQVYFKTPATLKDGNALIAAKDASNNILWSWHIWVCNGWDPTATAQKYYNKSNGIYSYGAVMDRNLGATSASVNDVKSFGLLYQWGRKDPFLGWDGTDPEGHTPAASTLRWPDPVKTDSSTGTIEYAIAHPTTILYPGQVSSNVDWYYTDVENTTDNTRWQEKKDLYDPCPAGWTLPRAFVQKDEGLWFDALVHYPVYIQDWDRTVHGYDFAGLLGDAASIWYPFNSFYSYIDGKLYNGENAIINIWSSDVSADPTMVDGIVFHVDINFQEHLEVKAASYQARAEAYPTRCVAVK